jgi:hypothetical protein
MSLEIAYVEPFPLRFRCILEAARAIVASGGDL